MGMVKKIGEEFYIEFEARGLKYQQKAGTDEAAARCLLEEVEGKIKKGEMGAIIRDVDTDIFFLDFNRFIKEQHTIRTQRRFESLISHFHAFLKRVYPTAVKLSQVTPVVFEQYKSHLEKETSLPVRPANREKLINLSFYLLFEIFQHAIKLGYLNDNPTLHVRLFTIPVKRRTDGLSKPQREALMAELMSGLQKQRTGDAQSLCLQFRELLYNYGLKMGVNLASLRQALAVDLLGRGIALGVLYQYLGLSDIARTLVYASFIPDKRKELYE